MRPGSKCARNIRTQNSQKEGSRTPTEDFEPFLSRILADRSCSKLYLGETDRASCPICPSHICTKFCRINQTSLNFGKLRQQIFEFEGSYLNSPFSGFRAKQCQLLATKQADFWEVLVSCGSAFKPN